MIKVAMSLALAAASAQSADQFDLICTGKSQGYPADQSENATYHVDLAAKQWCRGECSVQVIERIEPSVIWFKDQPTTSGKGEWIEYVDRVSGKWVREMGPWVTEGTCEPAPFTGFPSAPNKF